jgi:predicted ester cyclase
LSVSAHRIWQIEKGDLMSTQQNTEIVLRLYEQFDKGCLDSCAESIDPNFEAHVLGTTTLDWTGFKEFARAFFSAFADGRHVFDHVAADGENVVTVGIYQGRHTGDLHGLPPTHRELRLAVMHIDRVVNGRIAEHRGLANELDFMRQLGVVMEPKGGGA